MSDRFVAGGDFSRIAETFQLTELPQVDVEKFDTVERAAVERVITEQQESLARLQSNVLDVRAERDALDHRLSTLIDDRDRLQDRVRELEAERPALEPKAVFANLGAALEAADDDLSTERYRVDDVDFTLKANLTQTEDGVRMHLPSLDESSVAANLSEVSFRMRAPREREERPEAEYVDVPDVRGQSREVAARRLAGAGLSVGTVEQVPDPTAAPGSVVEQFPDAYAVAEPDAPVDLLVAEAGEAPADEETTDAPAGEETTDAPADDETPAESTDGPPAAAEAETRTDRGEDETARMEAFRRAIVAVAPEVGPAVADRLQRAGVTDLESLLRFDADELAERLSIPAEQIVALQRRLESVAEQRSLESISGIGPTYAERLRDEGVETVADLATLDPETVSAITRASTSRTEGWIKQARQVTAER